MTYLRAFIKIFIILKSGIISKPLTNEISYSKIDSIKYKLLKDRSRKYLAILGLNFRNYSSHTMQTGTIARLTDRGFGFIAREGEKDIFFHSNELVNVQYSDLREGDKVTFEVAQGPKGPNAVKVSKA